MSQNIPLFSVLNENELDALSRLAMSRSYPKNSVIINGAQIVFSNVESKAIGQRWPVYAVSLAIRIHNVLVCERL